MIKLVILVLVLISLVPLAAYAQGTADSPDIQSGIPKLEMDDLINSERFKDVLRKNIDIPKIENILRKNSDQKNSLGEGITTELVIDFIKDSFRELLHSIWGLIYNLLHLLGLEKYLRYLPRF